MIGWYKLKIQDYDMSKQDVNMQDTIEDVRSILNLGNYEIKKIALANPNWSESVDGILVLSVYGAQYRLYISDTSATNGWRYVDLTSL